MVRIRRALIVLQVAGGASRAGQVVIIVDMTIDALPRRHSVRIIQDEPGSRVIERRSTPGDRAVALLAGLRKIGLHVVGIRRVLVVLQVARHTGCRRQVVIPIDVAIGALAWRVRMSVRQRESSRGVIEASGLPGDRAVALFAGLRKIGAHVIRVGGGLIILQVARSAGSGGEIEAVVLMAIHALPRRHGVRVIQHKSINRVVKT